MSPRPYAETQPVAAQAGEVLFASCLLQSIAQPGVTLRLHTKSGALLNARLTRRAALELAEGLQDMAELLDDDEEEGAPT